MATFLYNPDRKPKGQLIAEFVVRKNIFENIFNDIESSSMKHPEQHYLIVGQRGSGKTTLLTRLKYAVEDSKKLNKWLVPIIFSEEQYNISELANLWESIAQHLEDYADFSGIYKEMESNISKPNFEQLCFDILIKHLENSGKKVILFIDNISDLLKKFDILEVRRLREILQTSPSIRLVAGSAFMLDSVVDYHQPLLEFFKVIRLDGLTKEETYDLLLKLGEVFNEKEKIEKIIKETPQRIDILRTLAGGVPRTIALLFQVFIDDSHNDSLNDLEKILDAVTPLYKHRMDDLPTQQQKIIDAVAKNWDAISVSELKGKVRLESKAISAQLRQLEQNQVIEKVPTRTKNHLYLLKERFFNIWYLMRYGRKDDRQRVIWLVKFLESWCSDLDLENRIEDYANKIEAGLLNIDTSAFYGQVYASLKNIKPASKYALKKSAPHSVSSQINLNEGEIIELAKKFHSEGKFEEAVDVFSHVNVLSFKGKEILYDIFEDFFSKDYNKYIIYLTRKFKADNLKLANSFDFCVTLQLLYALSLFSIHNNEMEKVIANIDLVIKLVNQSGIDYLNAELVFLGAFAFVLISDKKFNIANKLFTEIKIVDLKEYCKPVYYVLIYFSKGKNSVEFLRMGNELEEIVYKLIYMAEERITKFSKK